MDHLAGPVQGKFKCVCSGYLSVIFCFVLAAPTQPALVFDKVTLAHGANPPLLKDISFSLERGSFCFLQGPSGSGKTSFFRTLLMGMEPSSGAVSVLGQKIRGLTLAARSKLRRRMGVIFQDLRLLDHLSVLENVALPLHVRGFEIEEALQQAKDLLAWLGVEIEKDQPLHTLSGGEKQRIAIARAVMCKPALLLADEPTGQVDEKTGMQIITLLYRLNKIGTTVVIATHNPLFLQAFPCDILAIRNQTIHLVRQRQAPEQENRPPQEPIVAGGAS